MAVVKVIEIMTESEKGWEDATKIALKEASKYKWRTFKSIECTPFLKLHPF